jgi:hypothetical protein
MQTLVNRFAPPAYLGMGSAPGERIDVYDYVLDVVLTANQITQVQKSIDTDSDFLWEAVKITTATGTFNVQFTDARRYQLSDGYLPSTVYTGADPYALGNALVEPAGGRFLVNLQDTSGAGNTIQIVFQGAKRYFTQG